MKKLLILLLVFPLMMFAQDSTLIGDVDCSGEVNSQDASLILQFVTNVINELPCQDNLTGLTPEQLQEIINMMDEQLNINYTGGGSSNYPVMVSSISGEMNFGDALIYCSDLEEGGYSDWFLPSLDLLAYAISGGCELPDERTDQALWTTSKEPKGYGTNTLIHESGSSGLTSDNSSSSQECRCVRFGEGETGESSSGSSNSSGSSILGNSEQPITMIGPMYIADDFPEFNHLNNDSGSDSYTYGGWSLHYHHAIRFCGELNYNGFSDWSLPSLNQILHYLANNNSSDLGITNLSNLDYINSGSIEFWSLTDTGDSDSGASPNHKATFFIYNNNATMTSWDESTIDVANKLNYIESETIGSRRFCFCVR